MGRLFETRVLKSLLLASSAGLATLAASPALAQDPASDEPEANEVITVTGSRIKRDADDVALPVTVVGSEEIRMSGEPTVADVLKQLPVNSFGSSANTSGNAGSTGQATQNVDLRGLGTGRTLSLLNGRRLPPDGAFFAFDTSLTFIPLAMVDRVEVLRGGGSPVYGSDALGGVVNVILKDDFEGGQVSAQYGTPFEFGRDEYVVNGIYGVNLDRGNIVAAVEWREIDSLARGDVPGLRAAPDLGFGYTSNSVPPTFTIRDVFGDGTNVLSPTIAAPGCDTSLVRSTPGRTVTNPVTLATINYASTSECRFNNNDQNDFTSKTSALSGFLRGNYDLTDSLNVFVELLISDNETRSKTTPSTLSGLTMAATNPNNPTALARPGAPVFGVTGPRAIGFNLSSAIDNFVEIENTQSFFAGGFSWNSELGSLEGYYHRAQSDADQHWINTISTAQIQAAINSGALNPFGSIDAAAPAFTAASGEFVRETRGRVQTFNISWSGKAPFLSLPGGDTQYAIGYENRSELYAESGSGDGSGTGFNNGFALAANNRRHVNSVFGEVVLPVFDSLELSWAGRWDDYDVPDFKKLSNRAAFAWDVASTIAARGSFTQGIAAPNLFFSTGNTAQLNSQVVDTRRCNAAGNNPANPVCQPVTVLQTLQGGNDLGPETADNYNLGLVWKPSSAFFASIDYFRVELDDQVTNLANQTVVDLEAAGANLADFGVSLTRDAGGTITALSSGATNVPGFTTDGLDVEFGLKRDFESLGDLSSSFALTWVSSYKRRAAPNQPLLDAIGFRGTPEYRAVWSNSLRRGDFLYNLRLAHVAGYEGRTPEQANQGVAPIGEVSAYTTVDISAVWYTPWNGNFFVGIRNALNEEPTYDRAIFGTGGFDSRNSSSLGRVLSVRYTQNF